MMRLRAGFVAAAIVTAGTLPLASSGVRAESNQPVQQQATALPAPPAQNSNAVESPTAAPAQNCPGNPNALGTSRVLPIDFAEYQQLGRMQYPDSLPLNDKEVVITFDDGPLPPYTTSVLDILAAQCVKATFFMVGEMARAFPATVRQVYEQGHTIGTHSDHHPIGIGRLPLERMQAEVDGGIADVSAAFGGDSRYLAPFFRIPGLDTSALLESELAKRELIIFSSDVVADDWHRGITPAKITSLAMSRLDKRGRGILLLHDIHAKTVAALPGLLDQLKAGGYHVVQVVPSASYETAMARRPHPGLLASAMPGDIALANAGAAPAWPQAADGAMPDDIVLPAPDAAAFEPDADLNDSADVAWPPAPPPTAAPAALKRAARHGEHRRLAERGERKNQPKGAKLKEGNAHSVHAAAAEQTDRHRHLEHDRVEHNRVEHGHAGSRGENHRAALTDRNVT